MDPGILCSTEAAIFRSVIHKTGDEVAGLADQWRCRWHSLWSWWTLWHLERKRGRSAQSQPIHQRCPYPSICTLNLIRYTHAYRNNMKSTWTLFNFLKQQFTQKEALFGHYLLIYCCFKPNSCRFVFLRNTKSRITANRLGINNHRIFLWYIPDFILNVHYSREKNKNILLD